MWNPICQNSRIRQLCDVFNISERLLTSEKRCAQCREYDFDYILPDDNFKADLILIAVKADGFAWVKENIKKFVGKNTIVMSLLYGITSEEITDIFWKKVDRTLERMEQKK